VTRPYFLVVAALLGVAPSAFAAPSAADKAAAQTLFDDALKLLAAKNYEAACKKLDESNRLDPAMGTKYRLGECYEHIGRTASAWAIFREVADEAKATNQAEREKRARERANKLEGKLARLTIQAPKGVDVKKDGAPVGEGQLGVAMPIDPGSHTIEASAPGKKTWSSNVEVAASSSQSISVPDLVDAPVEKKDTEAREQPPTTSTWQKPVGIAAIGVGVVSLGVSTALILSARSTMRDSDSHCAGSACDREGVDLRDRAVARGNLATAFFVIGLVGAAGGTVLYLTAPSDTAPRVGIAPGFLQIEGRF
jgi:hypothetical protein